MINEKTMNAGNEFDPHQRQVLSFSQKEKKKKGQVLSSFLTIDIVGLGNLRGIFFFLQEKKTLSILFLHLSLLTARFLFFVVVFYFILFYGSRLFIRLTLKCHNNRTRRNFRFTYCLYAKYCRK